MIALLSKNQLRKLSQTCSILLYAGASMWGFFHNSGDDIGLYNEFISLFPSFYQPGVEGYVGVFYLPYFFFLYLPLSFSPHSFQFFTITGLSLLSILNIYNASKFQEYCLPFQYTLIIFFPCIAFFHARWANLEIIVFGIYAWLYTQNPKKRSAFWAAFWLFKITPVGFVFFFAVEKEDTSFLGKKGMIFLLKVLGWQILFNCIFFSVSEYWHLEYWINAFGNRHPGITGPQVLTLVFFRATVLFPLVLYGHRIYTWAHSSFK